MYHAPATHVVEAPDGGEARYRYRTYVPDGLVRGLVAYLPHFGGTLEDWETSLLPPTFTA